MFLTRASFLQRAIALTMIPLQFAVATPVPLLASAPSSQRSSDHTPPSFKSIMASLEVARASPVPRLPDAKEIRSSQAAPQVAPLNLPSLNRKHPTRQALESRSGLGLPVAAIGSAENSAENRAFLEASRSLTDWRGGGRPEAAERFVGERPDSVWTPSLQANLGREYYRHGYFTKALEAWGSAWETTRDAEEPQIKALSDRAGAELAGLFSRLGRMEDLADLLEEFRNRPLEGVTANLIEEAWGALEAMRTEPGISFKCGPFALRSIQLHQGQTPAALLDEVQSPREGFSLMEVQMMADAAEIPMQAAFRRPGASVMLPAVVHWKSDHYAAILESQGSRVLMRDPTFDKKSWITIDALDEEGSGYFLVPAGDLPAGWRPVSAREADKVFGKGIHATRSREGDCGDGGGCGGGSGGGGKNASGGQLNAMAKGMAQYSFDRFHASLKIQDTPLFYEPPYGEPVHFTFSYNQRGWDVRENKGVSHVGPRWTLNWLTYPEWDENTTQVRFYRRDGRREHHELNQADGHGGESGTFKYPLYAVAQGESMSTSSTPVVGVPHEIYEASYPNFVSHNAVSVRMMETWHDEWGTQIEREPKELKLYRKDGSIEEYNHVVEVAPGSFRWLPTRYVDPTGNETKLHYQLDRPLFPGDETGDPEDYRLAAIEDAAGELSWFHYEDVEDVFRITSITDPFHTSSSPRKTELEYDALGRLTKITDVIGMESSFSYEHPLRPDFIDSMTTPYGTTQFNRDSRMEGMPAIAATDSLGRTERVMMSSGDAVYGLPAFDENVPTGYELFNQDLHKYVTLYWNWQTYAKHPPGSPDHNVNAEQIKWLNDKDNTSAYTPVRRSIKRPGESRIWYNYEGQSGHYGNVRGESRLPIEVARVAETEPQIDEVWQYEYNSVGLPTLVVDPKGRETKYEYAANEIDLLAVKQKVAGGQWATLMTLGDYWKRLPREITDAAGQTTLLDYNSRGQLVSVKNALNEETVFRYHPDTGFDPETGTPGNQPGFLVEIEEPEIAPGIPGPVTRLGYDVYQRINRMITPDDAKLEYAYDGLHRPVRTTYPDQTFEQTDYHRLDISAVRNREGRWTRYWYDSGGQLRLERDPLGSYTQYEWCTCGGLGALIDGEGNRTEWKYDLQGRMTKKIYSDLTEEEYHYHEQTGRLELAVDALDRTRTYTHWIDGNLRKIDYGQPSGLPSTPSVEYFYDDFFNRMTQMIDGIGSTTYTYHPVDGATSGAGLVHEIDGPFANDMLTFTYDELGRRSKRQINGTVNEETYAYDPVGRLEAIVNPLGQFSFEYVNPTARLAKLIYPNGQVTNFDYHGELDDFRLKEIENLGAGANPDPLSVFGYTYSPTGMIETWTQQTGTGNPNTWTFGYDRAHQLRDAVLRDSGSSVVESFAYGYDRAGNRTHERHAAGALGDTSGRGAVHNENNQLVSYSDAGAVRFAGEIDQGGIVWVDGEQAEMGVDDSGAQPVQTFEAWISLEPGIQQIAIDAVNAAGKASHKIYELTIADQGRVDFGYDAGGNMISRSDGVDTTEYRWDGENRLMEIIYPDNSRTEFTYDGFGRRVRIHEKNSGGGTVANRTFVWDGLEIVEERNGMGATVTKQFFDHGVREGTNNYYYTKDHLGSIREVTDDQAALQARYDYDPYGRVTRTAGTFDADFLFTGHFYHAKNELHLAPYRAYDAEIGRWLNRDPLQWAELLPEGPGLYGYVGSNTISLIDSVGLSGATIQDSSSGFGSGGSGPGGAMTASDCFELYHNMYSRLTMQQLGKVLKGIVPGLFLTIIGGVGAGVGGGIGVIIGGGVAVGGLIMLIENGRQLAQLQELARELKRKMANCAEAAANEE